MGGRFVRFMPVVVAVLAMGFAAEPMMAADAIRLSGSTSLANLIKAKVSDIETKADVKLATVPNGSGRGVSDLVAGKSDLAMIGGPLPVIADSINAKTPGSVKVEELTVHVVASEPIAFIVNPANKTESLTSDQLRDVFTGKVTNWKDVGGADMAIMVVAPPASDGIRATLSGDLLNGAPMAKDTRVVNTGPDVNKIVSQVPGAISFLSASNKSDSVKILKDDKGYSAKLAFVAKGAPTDAQKKLIETVTATLSK